MGCWWWLPWPCQHSAKTHKMQCCILPMQEMKTWSPRAKMSFWLSSSSPRGINSQFKKLQDGVTCATLTIQRNDLRSTHINQVMLQHWWANADLQIIVDIWACARYVANYASKDDPRSLAVSYVGTGGYSDNWSMDRRYPYNASPRDRNRMRSELQY